MNKKALQAFKKADKETKLGVFTAYKLFLFEDDQPKNLYWALEGSRTIKKDKWLEGERRWRRDGGESRKYVTGIHVMLDPDYVDEYLKNFRTEKDRRLLLVYAKNIRVKPTNNKVYLADKIYIPSNQEMLSSIGELNLVDVV